jgi:hypothetical protein
MKRKNNEAKQTAYNRSVYAAPAVAGLVFRSLGHSAALHSHTHSRHIWAARNPTGFFIVPPKRRKQPERYAQFFLNWLEKLIDRKNKVLYKNVWRKKSWQRLFLNCFWQQFYILFFIYWQMLYCHFHKILRNWVLLVLEIKQHYYLC